MKPIEDSCRITFNVPSNLLLHAIPLAGDLGIEIETLFNEALADFVAKKLTQTNAEGRHSVSKPFPTRAAKGSTRKEQKRPGFIKQYGKEIQAGEDSGLTISGLSQYFSWSRLAIYQDIQRGYVLEFGDRSTPRHYREWLKTNPRPARKSGHSRIAEELAQLT